MTTMLFDCIWLDPQEPLSLSDLSHACGMTVQDMDELVEYGALTPLPLSLPEPVFSAEYMQPLKTAGKMRIDYDLDIFTVVLLMDGLRRIETLERRINQLEVLLPR